jgi:hypothetical protein
MEDCGLPICGNPAVSVEIRRRCARRSHRAGARDATTGAPASAVREGSRAPVGSGVDPGRRCACIESGRTSRPLSPVAPPRGRAMPAVSEGFRSGLRRDHEMSQNVTLPSRCRDVTRGHDLGSGRHRPPGSRASVRDRIRGGASAPVLWRRAAARPSAATTREAPPCPEPLQRCQDSTGPRDITESRRDGDPGPVLSFPCPHRVFRGPDPARRPVSKRGRNGANKANLLGDLSVYQSSS